MHARVRHRQELATALELAVERGEISVHYQPIVDLASNRMVAVEALARWQRTGRELLSPVSFIPLADEIGVMVEIGRAVVREACIQARSWQTTFPLEHGATINVNLAPSELHSPSLIREIAAVLEETGLEPDRLVLEITESGVMRNPDDALATMVGLRELGVRLALDDFGTGHSSLAHLRELPLDTLKIAKPFIAGLPDGHADAAFVEAIVTLATSLDIDVVAEGIETAAQAEAAVSLGCKLGQGFFFGSPLGQIGVTPYLTLGALPTVRTSCSAAGSSPRRRLSPPGSRPLRRTRPAPRPASRTSARGPGTLRCAPRRRTPRARPGSRARGSRSASRTGAGGPR